LTGGPIRLYRGEGKNSPARKDYLWKRNLFQTGGLNSLGDRVKERKAGGKT